MSEPGVTVAGGGSVAVDTPAMQAAARRLEALRDRLDALRRGIERCLAEPAWRGAAAARSAVEAAADHARLTDRDLAETGCGLRAAAERYGAVEQTITALQQEAWAGGAALTGAVTRIGVSVLGPGFALLPMAVGGVVLGSAALGTTVRELVTTGRVDPQVDPWVLADLRRALSSSDDLLRGFTLSEQPTDVVHDDPDSRYGTASTAAALAGLLPVGDPSIRLRTAELPGSVEGPGSLAELGERVPEVDPGGTQLRLERYPMPGGRSRWIVYVCGTITFSPAAGPEPFDLRSDVVGVDGRPSDSERAVAAAMRRAGVGRNDPVLLVGHSQGALDAVRLAQRGVFDVQGVVTLGGPTGQLEVPDDVPELSVEHDEDIVPALGGLSAGGAGGLRRLVVGRSLYGGAPPPGPPLVPFGAGAQPHALTAYRATLALADASPDPRIGAFERDVRPFLTASDGRIVLVRADRPVRPPRGHRGAAAADR
jgi:pimeloyl-ACP methyl ester carboxylesterase